MTTKNKRNKKNVFSFFEALMIMCLLFVGISIFLPYYIHEHKKEQINKDYYANELANNSQYASNYKSFWKQYNIILKDRGNTDNNPVISLQEKEAFDKAFFDDNELIVDEVSKDITKKDGTHPDPKVLTCLINNFYPQRPWIKPVCPSL